MATKANTLAFLASQLKLAVVDPFTTFTIEDWQRQRNVILKNLVSEFAQYQRLVVRSSTINEDQPTATFAGYFHSELNVPSSDEREVEAAIDRVIASYAKDERDIRPNDEVVIQAQASNIVISGVLLNYDLRLHSPYYLINYDDSSAATNNVTKGCIGQAVRIARWIDDAILPKNWHRLVLAAKEIEELFPNHVVDVEFGVTADGEIHVFQARAIGIIPPDLFSRIALVPAGVSKLVQQLDHQLHQSQDSLSGNGTILADMSDWNPAEMIGGRPKPLSFSLYQYLITHSAWNMARVSLGYIDVFPHELMVAVGDKPYVDLRVCFNSLTPAFIKGALRDKLINHYLEKIKTQPYLQDKVEFEIVLTCYDLSFANRVQELRSSSMSSKDILWLKDGLVNFTNTLLNRAEAFLAEDRKLIQMLERQRNESQIELTRDKSIENILRQVSLLLQNCREFGVIPFARQARIAFIGLALLHSLVREGVLSKHHFDEFLGTIDTVVVKLARDQYALSAGVLTLRDFLDRYGHLRPGTYDITATRYCDSPGLFTKAHDLYIPKHTDEKIFKLDGATLSLLDRALASHSLTLDANHLLSTIRLAIESREECKFEFTKSLSQAIEGIALVGEKVGLSREEMQHLDLNTILQLPGSRSRESKSIKKAWERTIKDKQSTKLTNRNIALPPVITKPNDILVVPYYESSPNFVTRKRVEADTSSIAFASRSGAEIIDKIVLLESADPGYDWIFTRRIQGLVTQYGGAASHMAIRCAELGIPAAIGCGELLFSQLRSARRIVLDADAETVAPII